MNEEQEETIQKLMKKIKLLNDEQKKKDESFNRDELG
jgi:hypothetical protein